MTYKVECVTLGVDLVTIIEIASLYVLNYDPHRSFTFLRSYWAMFTWPTAKIQLLPTRGSGTRVSVESPTPGIVLLHNQSI